MWPGRLAHAPVSRTPRTPRESGRSAWENSGWHGTNFYGQVALVLNASAELIAGVRSVLVQAGFPALSDAGSDVPGLRLTQTDAGVSVSWTASHRFTSLAREQAGRAPGRDSMRAMVLAAVSGVLVQQGLVVEETPDGEALIVRRGEVRTRGPVRRWDGSR